MSRSGFFNKIPWKAFLEGQKSISCHGYVLLDAYCCHFLHSFYIVVSDLEGNIVPWRHPCKPLAEIRNRFKGKTYFLEITMILGQTINKTGTDSK